MFSRNAYTALSPDFVDVPSNSLSADSEPDPEAPIDVPKQHNVQWGPTKDLFNNNIGLLLVGGSQAFFSLMNISVKVLNTMGPPVSSLEVRLTP